MDGENNVYGYNYGEAGLTGTRLGELQSFTAPLGDLRICLLYTSENFLTNFRRVPQNVLLIAY